MRVWHIAVVVAALLLGSGCSVKFAYNNLDRFARWGTSDYLNMNDEQRRYFDTEFAKLHYWHRTNHLTRYSDLLESLPAILTDGIDAKEMTAVEHTMMGWADEVEERGTPMVIGLMRSMTDEQVAELPKKLEASNKQIAKPEVGKSLDAAQAGWGDEVADIFAQFAGRLSARQRNYLASQSVRYLPERALWADYRRRWQADLMRLLEQRHDAVWFNDRFLQLSANRESYYGAELAHIFDNNEALGREVGGWLVNNMTEGQRTRLFERLLGFAETFRELAAEAGEPPR
jgi:hypothetical protein